MIEEGKIKKHKGSPFEEDVSYEIAFADESALQEIISLQDIIAGSLPYAEIFITHPIEYFRDLFKIERSVIGVFAKEHLIAYSLIYIPGEGKENLGRDINIPECDLKKAAHLQAAVVHPAYRGNLLQKRMAQYHLKVLEEMGYEHICCTVSPKNHVSLGNILSNGFVIKGLKAKFQGWWRYIMYKNNLRPSSIGSEQVKIRGSDIEGQIDLLNRDFVGCRIESGPEGFQLIYCR